MKRTRLAYPYIFVWMPLFIVAPMLFVAYYAFFDNGTFTTEYVKQVLFKHDLSSLAVELHLDRIGNNRRVPSCGISGCIYSFKHEKNVRRHCFRYCS